MEAKYYINELTYFKLQDALKQMNVRPGADQSIYVSCPGGFDGPANFALSQDGGGGLLLTIMKHRVQESGIRELESRIAELEHELVKTQKERESWHKRALDRQEVIKRLQPSIDEASANISHMVDAIYDMQDIITAEGYK